MTLDRHFDCGGETLRVDAPRDADFVMNDPRLVAPIQVQIELVEQVQVRFG
jgi:hypothetical protein